MKQEANPTIKAIKVCPGMILSIYGGGEEFHVEAVKANEFGAVIITNWSGMSRGLSHDENVQILGYFNPSGVGVYA